ncbi:MAG TPA: hypothetical protein VMH40_22740 [Myxococcaceae bacterium]|nr:hypothetical protein [Myxococcaceae bacterium]
MKALSVLAVLAILSACGSSGGGDSNNGGGNNTGPGSDAGTTPDAGSGTGYLIGGTILTAGANGLVLQTPGEPNLAIGLTSYPPAFHFANKVPTGTGYNVTISSQPVTPQCGGICTCAVIDGGVGTVGTADVTDIQVACAIQLP